MGLRFFASGRFEIFSEEYRFFRVVGNSSLRGEIILGVLEFFRRHYSFFRRS